MNAFYRIIRSTAPYLPRWIKELVRSLVSAKDYDFAVQRASNPYCGMDEATYPGSRFRVGIVADINQDHQHYVAACRNLLLSYKVIDLLTDDWVSRFREERFDAVLVWPCCVTTVIKQVYDYRLRILEHDLGVLLYPTWQECWLTEHKPRLRDWLDAHGFAHPKTWVYHDRSQALAFAETVPLPIVSKTATGAGASGVTIVRDRDLLIRVIKQAFGAGLRPKRYEARDRQRGFVYLQEYLPDVHEWRMVRIGDSYFGYRKEKGADGLHSASHKWSWLDPGAELLNLLKAVTDAGGSTSMDVDVFLTPDGRLLINELQTVFGCTTPVIYMKVNDVEGRYLVEDGAWKFEAGTRFWQNHMCDLRVEYVLELLERRVAGMGA
jgi:glutathione synthase/RimK-type ligase-like ATP-grasp enzyme